MSREKLIKKFILGSANFTQKYGVDPKKLKYREIKNILNSAYKNNITKIDTADDYIKNHEIFKKKTFNKFKIISKIKPNNKWVSLNYCQKKIKTHYKILNTNNLETLLIHNSDILLKKNGSIIFENIKTLKNKYFKKIGVSIYEIEDLDYLVKNYPIDVIQCPYNILDKRLVSSGWLKKLKKIGIEVHVRSIFLQGLLVNKNICQKKYFKKWKKDILKWYENLENLSISSIDYCINDLMNYEFDQIIVGINNINQLNDILNFKKIKINKVLKKPKINNLNLIDPRKWK